MKLITDIDNYTSQTDKPLVLALGNFDGIHLGHRALLEKVVLKAKGHGALAAVLTFKDHPQSILHPGSSPSLLISNEQKLALLSQLGINLCFFISFTKEFSKMEPETFVQNVLVKHLKVKEVCLGFNARFGRGRKGDSGLMQRLARKHEFQFEPLEALEVKGGSCL